MYVVVRDWDVDFSMVWDWVEGFFCLVSGVEENEG